MKTPNSHVVNQVGEARREEHEYAFTITGDQKDNMITISVGGVDLDMLIDSGATSNNLDEDTWESLKEKHVKCVSRVTTGKNPICVWFGQTIARER